MERRTLLVLVIVFFVAAVVIVATNTSRQIQEHTLQASVEIVAMDETKDNITVGMDVSRSELAFGRVPERGADLKRSVLVGNNRSSPVDIAIEIDGNITRLLRVEDRNLALGAFDSQNVTMTVRPQQVQETGFYDGLITVKTFSR